MPEYKPRNKLLHTTKLYSWAGLEWTNRRQLTLGGGPHPHYAAFCRCHTNQFAAMTAAKCGKFLAFFKHNFRQVTHYVMVIERWNIAENNRRVNNRTYYKATDILRDLFFNIWANNGFSFLKMQGGPRRIWQIFILRSDRLENSVKRTAMARFICSLWSNMYPYWLTLRDTGKNRFFDLPP